jgi:hypothetical protein
MQPWLWAVLHAQKRIENRVAWTNCAYRGPILLHASKGVGNRREFDGAANTILDVVCDGVPLSKVPEGSPLRAKASHPWAMDDGWHPHLPGIMARPFAVAKNDLRGLGTETLWTPAPLLARGGIVGRARIDGVIRSEADMAAYAANVPDGEYQRRWWFGRFALVLTDVEELPFTPWKGELGLFEVDETQLRAA